MEKILKNKRTNEQTNERSSERIEQKFMNEILSKTREIEDYSGEKKSYSFFRHDNRLFREFLQNIGNCYYLYILCEKKTRNIQKKFNEHVQKWHISGIFGWKKMFFENRAPSHFRYCHFASVCKISWKNIKYSSKNSRNAVFPAKIGCSGDF